jgi:molecular chaperone GrpE (heat shock protein)
MNKADKEKIKALDKQVSKQMKDYTGAVEIAEQQTLRFTPKSDYIIGYAAEDIKAGQMITIDNTGKARVARETKDEYKERVKKAETFRL